MSTADTGSLCGIDPRRGRVHARSVTGQETSRTENVDGNVVLRGKQKMSTMNEGCPLANDDGISHQRLLLYAVANTNE